MATDAGYRPPRPPPGPPPSFAPRVRPVLGASAGFAPPPDMAGAAAGGIPRPLGLGGMAPRPPAGPPPAGLVAPFAPRPGATGSMMMAPRPPVGRPPGPAMLMGPRGGGGGATTLPPITRGPPGDHGASLLPPLTPSGGGSTLAMTLPGAMPETPGGRGAGDAAAGGAGAASGSGGPGGTLSPFMATKLTTAGGVHPFGHLTLIVQGCKGLTRVAAEAAARSFVRVRIGDQTQATGPAKEGGARPRYGDELPFDIRNEREATVELVARRGEDEMGPEVILGTARTSIMPWIARGRFEGDVELRDPLLQPCGMMIFATRYEPSEATAAATVSIKPAATLPGAAATRVDASQALPADVAGAVKNPNSAVFSDKDIRDAFLAFDLDGNNFIGAAEIRHILQAIGETVTDEEVDEMIRMVDRDGDGQVSFPEFYRMLTGGREPPPGLAGRDMPPQAVAALDSGLPMSAIAAATGAGAAGGAAGGGGSGGGGALDMAALIEKRGARKAAMEAFVRNYGLRMERLKTAWQEFSAKDRLGEGIIEFPAFCEFLVVEPTPDVEAVFKLFDPDTTGSLRFAEFLSGAANFVVASKEERAKFVFTLFDGNEDGTIDKEEVARILVGNHMAGSTAEVGKKADTIMETADGNKDGFITYEEFVRVSERFPKIIFPAVK